jgi:hypothetical protein
MRVFIRKIPLDRGASLIRNNSLPGPHRRTMSLDVNIEGKKNAI